MKRLETIGNKDLLKHPYQLGLFIEIVLQNQMINLNAAIINANDGLVNIATSLFAAYLLRTQTVCRNS